MRRAVATDEVRGTGTRAVARRAILHRTHDVGVIGETEVVVTAEGEQPFVVDRDLDALRARENLALAIEVRPSTLFEILAKRTHCASVLQPPSSFPPPLRGG